MKLLVILSSVVLISAKSLNLKQLEYGFCGETKTNQRICSMRGLID